MCDWSLEVKSSLCDGVGRNVDEWFSGVANIWDPQIHKGSSISRDFIVAVEQIFSVFPHPVLSPSLYFRAVGIMWPPRTTKDDFHSTVWVSGNWAEFWSISTVWRYGDLWIFLNKVQNVLNSYFASNGRN